MTCLLAPSDTHTARPAGRIRVPLRLLAAFALVVAGCADVTRPLSSRPVDSGPVARPTPAATGKENPVALEHDCLARWKMTASTSVLAEQRSRGPRHDDFFARYPAATIDPAAQVPLQCVSRFLLADRPHLWLTADARDVVIDRAFSSDLTAVDATALGEGERITLGVLTAAARALPDREVLEFLIRADVLRTYAHVESSVCLDDERHGGGGYRATLHGRHTFFTNERNVRPFAFAFERTATGELIASGGGPVR